MNERSMTKKSSLTSFGATKTSFGGVLTITGAYPVTAAEAGLEGVLSARSGRLGRCGYL